MSWNDSNQPKDPWGGNRNQPDELEALFKKIKDVLGSGNSKNANNNTPNLPSFSPKAIFGLMMVGLALWATLGFYTVENAERGVVTRFGKFSHITTEGLNWHLPSPIEKVEIINITRVRSAEIGFRQNQNKILSEALMLTKDENIVDVQLTVQYQINNAKDFLFNVRDPETTLRDATESALRQVVGRNLMDTVLTEGREAVVADVKSLLQGILDDYKTGLQIYTVNMQGASAPQQVQAAFDDAVKAREDKERFVNEAQAYSNQILPQARGEAARIAEDAIAYRERVIAEATGQAERFSSVYNEYRKAPLVTRERLYIQAMENVLQQSNKVLVDIEGGNNLLYLPIDKLVAPNAANTNQQSLQDLTRSIIPNNGSQSRQNRGRTR